MDKTDACEMKEERGEGGINEVAIQYQAGGTTKTSDTVGMKAVFTENEMSQTRRMFIRKMYTVISIQLVTLFIMCCIALNGKVQEFIFSHITLFWIIIVIACLILVSSLIFRSFTRVTPCNFIFLALLTLCEAYAIACCCCVYNPLHVLYLIGLMTLLTITLTLYSFRESDIDMTNGLLIALLLSMALLGLSALLNPFAESLIWTMEGFGFAFYLLIYTQLTIGKFGEDYDCEDYIYASLCLYLDVVQVFLYLMEILSKKINK